MSGKIRKKSHSSGFKFKVALEALKGNKTSAELCQEYGVASSQVFKWKKELLDHGAEVFNKGVSRDGISNQEVEKLHAVIGKLKVENDFLSKFAGVDQ